jgi:hypothetical protein
MTQVATKSSQTNTQKAPYFLGPPGAAHVEILQIVARYVHFLQKHQLDVSYTEAYLKEKPHAI